MRGHIKSKKGQETVGPSGAAASALVAIIGLMIILYIMFLPPADREELLGINSSEDGDTSDEGDLAGTSEVFNETTILVKGLKLDYINQKDIEMNFPALHLFTQTEGEVVKEQDSLYVKNALFSKSFENITFYIEDLDNTDNILLSMLAKTRRGMLIVKLNGREIYNSKVESENVGPIKLRKEYLTGENILEFSAPNPGFAFWNKNEFELKDIKVTGDLTDISRQESRNIFVLSLDDVNNIREATLRFSPDCTPRDVGRLDVIINDYTIYSGVPDCGILNVHKFASHRLRRGENKLVFRAESGSYLVEQINIKAELKEPRDYVYYFDIGEDEYKGVITGDANVNLSMNFVDTIEEKEAKLIINGYVTYMSNTRALSFSKVINNYIEQGYNSIKIEPQQTFHIRNMKIKIE